MSITTQLKHDKKKPESVAANSHSRTNCHDYKYLDQALPHSMKRIEICASTMWSCREKIGGHVWW